MKIKPECVGHPAHDSNLSHLASADNQFTIDVLKTLLLHDTKGEKKNVIISPFNASQALSMLLFGSKAKTFTQLAQTLHYDKILKDITSLTPKNREMLHITIKEMNAALTKLSKHVTLDIGNGLYPDNMFPLDSHYLEVIKGTYKAIVHNLNIAKDPRQAEKVINEDVAHATKGMIKNLLPPNSLNSTTRMVLTSTIYFKGDWHEKFDHSLTQKMPFISDDGHTQEIPMMQGFKSVNYAKINFSDHVGQEVEVLRLDYKDEELGMFFVLPRQNGLKQFIQDLNPERLNKLVKDLHLEKKIWISIPLFKIGYETELKETLQELGTHDIFGDNADLSGISGNTKEKLTLTQMYHKAFIEVNEEGSEAGAATGGVIGVTSVQDPVRFIANKPFLYFIMDLVNGCILFIGTFALPKSD
ncbi:unnamed protein product [Gordionus sp. m RMFG-2023]